MTLRATISCDTGATADRVLDANVQPIAAAAVNQAVNYRRDNRRRKQRVMSWREQEAQEGLWQAKKEQQRKLKMQLERRQQRLQALAAARAAAKQKAAAIRLAAAAAAAAAAAGTAAGGATGGASGVPARANIRRRCPNRKYLEEVSSVSKPYTDKQDMFVFVSIIS